jgi:hypothetical protein
MFAANTYLIRPARDEDADTLVRLAARDSRAPLAGRVLIGQIDGTTVAAISLADGRSVTDTSRATGHLLACMRIRAQALRAYEATPSLPMRMVSGLSSYIRPDVQGDDGRSSQERATAARAAAGRRGRRRRVRRPVATVEQ